MAVDLTIQWQRTAWRAGWRPPGDKPVSEKVVTYLTTIKMWDRLCKLTLSIGEIAQRILKAFNHEVIATAMARAIKYIAAGRSIIKLADWAGNIRSFIVNPYIPSSATKMKIASGFFNITGNIGTATCTLAKFGCIALKEVAAKGLGLASSAFSLVGLGISIASFAYHASNVSDSTHSPWRDFFSLPNILHITRKSLDAAGLALVVFLTAAPIMGLALTAVVTTTLSVIVAVLGTVSCGIALYSLYQKA